MNTELFNRYLLPGEQIRWAGRPQSFPFLDPENRKPILIQEIALAIGAVVLIVLYIVASLSRGNAVNPVLIVAILVVLAIPAASPLISYNKLKKVVYAVTDSRILKLTGESEYTECSLAAVDELRLVRTVDGYSDLHIGSPTFSLRPGQVLDAGCIGVTVDSEDGKNVFPVFYHIEDPAVAEAVLRQYAPRL